MTGTLHLHGARRVEVNKAEWMEITGSQSGIKGTWKMDISVVDCTGGWTTITVFFQDRDQTKAPDVLVFD